MTSASLRHSTPAVMRLWSYEVAAHTVAHAAGAAVQHEPYVFRFIETNFDEVVAGAQRAEVIRLIAAIEFRVFFQNGVVTRLERLPGFVVARGNFGPGAYVASAA